MSGARQLPRGHATSLRRVTARLPPGCFGGKRSRGALAGRLAGTDGNAQLGGFPEARWHEVVTEAEKRGLL